MARYAYRYNGTVLTYFGQPRRLITIGQFTENLATALAYAGRAEPLQLHCWRSNEPNDHEKLQAITTIVAIALLCVLIAMVYQLQQSREPLSSPRTF